MAFLTTYHQHGEQKHAVASWLKELVEHPTQVLAFDDVRHWSERTAVMLCMQTTDTSIDLYWHDGLLRSRHGSSGGLLTGTTIMCQCHGSRFDITPGAVISGPATEGLNVYEVREGEGSIHVRA